MKKLLVLICVIIMSLCIFTACKESENNTSQDNERTVVSGEDLIDQISEEIKEVFD